MRNQYPGNCFLCNKRVESGEGFFQKVSHIPADIRSIQIFPAKWLIRCKGCAGKGNIINKEKTIWKNHNQFKI